MAAATLAIAAAMVGGCEEAPDRDRAAIEREILETPRSGALWAAIKREYPGDFARLVEQVQALNLSERGDSARGEQIGKEWLQDFFTRIAPEAVQAPAEAMLRWSMAEAKLYETLERHAPDACAAMTMGEWIFIEDDDAAAYDAIAARNIAMVEAASAGRADPQVYDEPDRAAFDRLGDAIAGTGLAPELQQALAAPDALGELAPEDQCAIGVALHQAIADLPDDAEPAMAAYMLAPAN
ncbi:hypothetical protein MACH05_09040 [Qipengyuania nanhaisediminis]